MVARHTVNVQERVQIPEAPLYPQGYFDSSVIGSTTSCLLARQGSIPGVELRRSNEYFIQEVEF